MALGARKGDKVVCSGRDVRADGLGSRNSTHGHRLAALAVAADHEPHDPGADGECEGDQDDQSLGSDGGNIELASNGRV